MARIIVIGAGVIGLTTAYLLQKEGHKVLIVAKSLPGDMDIEYTSPFAGAHWRTMAPNTDKRLQEFDAVTYKKLMQLGQIQGAETGIMIIPSTDYYDEVTPETEKPWFQDLVEDFQFVPPEALPPEAKVGHQYTTVVVNTPHYLRWLLHQFITQGGQVQRATLSHIQDVFGMEHRGGKPDAVVNCTGLGARYLDGVNDIAMFPTRGQTVVVWAPHVRRTITRMGKDYITYIIPRSDGTVVLGGTMDKNDYNPHAEKDVARSILSRTNKLCPELTQGPEPFRIVRHAVGLRPSRTQGPRIENQVYTKADGQPILVTHAYGHGGFGYQSSWGSAAYTVRLVEQGLLRTSKI